ncbi:MAG: cell division protein FtsB [Proteobacteria bacterium]|nr:MAG: cell division protein FtsB [Pseudomonadota bacterium]
MKYLITIMVVLLTLLLISLWVGHGSYPAKWQLESEIRAMKDRNDIQREKNRQIRSELEEAHSGSAAVEERARSELGMIRNRETFYEVILKKKEQEQ